MLNYNIAIIGACDYVAAMLSNYFVQYTKNSLLLFEDIEKYSYFTLAPTLLAKSRYNLHLYSNEEEVLHLLQLFKADTILNFTSLDVASMSAEVKVLNCNKQSSDLDLIRKGTQVVYGEVFGPRALANGTKFSKMFKALYEDKMPDSGEPNLNLSHKLEHWSYAKTIFEKISWLMNLEVQNLPKMADLSSKYQASEAHITDFLIKKMQGEETELSLIEDHDCNIILPELDTNLEHYLEHAACWYRDNWENTVRSNSNGS